MDIDHIGERFRSMRSKLKVSQKEFSIFLLSEGSSLLFRHKS